MKPGLDALSYGDALPIYQQTDMVQHQCYLEDEVLDAVLEIDDVDSAKENGVDAIIERLNGSFKKDSTTSIFK